MFKGKTSNTKQKVKRYEKDIRCYTESVDPVYSFEIFRLTTNLVQHGMHLATPIQ